MKNNNNKIMNIASIIDENTSGSIIYSGKCDTIDKNIIITKIVTKNVMYCVNYEKLMKKLNPDYVAKSDAPKYAKYIVDDIVLANIRDPEKLYIKITNVENPKTHTIYYMNGNIVDYDEIKHLLKTKKYNGEIPIVQNISFDNIIAINNIMI